MSAFKPYSHLMASPSVSPRQSSPSPRPPSATLFEQEEQVGETTRLASPDSSAKQLEYSVDKLLHRHKSSQVNSSLCSSVSHDAFTRTSPGHLSSSSLATHGLAVELTSSNHWSNLNFLAHTLWWQKQRVSSSLATTGDTSLPPPPPPHHQHQLDSSETFLSAMTMASAASLYSPHLRRLLLPLTSTASVTGPRSQRGPRRQRTTFTHEQTLRLEMEYHVSEYISRGKRFQLAELLDLTESQIKIWFQNRRAKDKRIEKAVNEQQFRLVPIAHSTTSAGIHASPSDPCSTCDYTATFTATKQLLDTSARKE